MKSRILMIAVLLTFSFTSCKKEAEQTEGSSSEKVIETKEQKGQSGVEDNLAL